MTPFKDLQATGLLNQRVPRYTSYPPATAFQPVHDDAAYRAALAGLDPAEPVSLYVHIPFCERLCWFCACRTQGVRSLTPVAAYVDTLTRELALLQAALPARLAVKQLHFGGGTPTILSPALIRKLVATLDVHFDRASGIEFSVEVDPTLVDRAKIAAFADAGMTRASIGVQDFDPKVQQAIGRQQSLATTKACVADLRAAGIRSLNVDLVYGLPFQTPESFARTLSHALALKPDRIALFGYAHVPHMAKRQQLIAEDALPDDAGRHALFEQASNAFLAAGLNQIGIDHFARRGDSLDRAAKAGRLRRNFQGYTDDHARTLIGLGASAISRVGGYFQNQPGTAAYARQVTAGQLPIARNHVWSDEDRLRGRAIEMLMCDFRIDLPKLQSEFRLTEAFQVDLMACAARFGDLVTLDGSGLQLTKASCPLVRSIASHFDTYLTEGTLFSRVT